ncbi:MAG: glycerol-3-phosphate 1-O-acyltransferase PlsY [Candidatus Aminicenantes bacterium]|nr:glycerol-3-phosphate 1-O-acyltransferase PlsY [Candidatus Aminicenantes bacterium]
MTEKILFLLGAYLLGAFPTGYLLFRWSERQDIRRFGSGATGATNVLRFKGLALAAPVALIDIAKGAVPALLAQHLFGQAGFAALGASAAVIGHCFPVYIGFRGGKGVATAAGAMLSLAWVPALLCLGVFILAVAATRFVSVGSILAAVFFPVFAVLLGSPDELVLSSLPIVAVILVRHASNIRRLIRREERRFERPKGGEG